MRAQRLRRRIVWLLAAAGFGVAAIAGASVAAADEPRPEDVKWEHPPPDAPDTEATTQDSKWE
jgi:hypothetical protein